MTVAPDEELDGCPGGGRYQRTQDFRGHRDGTAPPRLTLGSRVVGLDQRCVRDSLDGQELDGPEILEDAERRSNTVDETFTTLLIEGLMNDDTRLVQQVDVIDE